MKKQKHHETLTSLAPLFFLICALGVWEGVPADRFPIRQFERQVVAEVNRARGDPREYARFLLESRPLYEGNRIRQGPGRYLVTQEGVAALDEAVAYLRKAPSLPALGLSRGMSLGAWDHVLDQSVSGKTGHAGSDGGKVWDRVAKYGRWLSSVGENIAYGGKTAEEVVAMLIIDDGVPDRGHRENIFSKSFSIMGVAHGKHPEFGTMCVMTFAGGYEEKEKMSLDE